VTLPPESIYASALLLGLFGSTHCIAMCGGIAAALGQSGPPGSGGTAWRGALLDSLGRITSYSIAGAGAGLFGEAFAAWSGLSTPIRLLAGALILVLGLHVAGWWNGSVVIERVGQAGWRRLAPLVRRIGPADRPWKRFALGLLWGWLPCGLVYAALVAAAAAGGALQGATFMACFGLGTLPALLALGGLGGQVRGLLARRSARRAAGAALVVFGFWSIAAVIAPLHGAPPGADGSAPAAAHPHHP
jgi:hypothetical protein